MKNSAVLCVDDEAIICLAMQTELRRIVPHNYIVVSACSGKEALEVIDSLISDEIDIVILITDNMMPNMSGAELVKLVAHLYPRIKIIMVTGYIHITEKEHLEEYIHKMFSKPWDRDTLKATVLNIINSLENQDLPPTN